MKSKTFKIMSVLFAMMLIAFSCTSVFAAPSPTGGKEVNVVVTPSDGGSAQYVVASEVGKGPNGGTLIELSPVANDGYTFVNWTIAGDYKINSGSLDSEKLVVETFGDITATPNFTTGGTTNPTSPSDSSATTPSSASNSPANNTTVVTNTSKTSPQTSTTPVLPIAISAIALASIGAVIVSRKLSK